MALDRIFGVILVLGIIMCGCGSQGTSRPVISETPQDAFGVPESTTPKSPESKDISSIRNDEFVVVVVESRNELDRSFLLDALSSSGIVGSLKTTDKTYDFINHRINDDKKKAVLVVPQKVLAKTIRILSQIYQNKDPTYYVP